ncbi:Elongation factor-like GTPase 1 (Elongation factor Tu GTP-binding domain-containing protein 1) (Elongation factor-like 1) (Protein FAM42A), partial [Durusdinium trenchii]
HGKTTLSDCLVSSNGIISERLAGTIRYLDSREDEQERGITMQSSAISLLYKHEKLNKDYLINLIDSPGHVDFSSDVSTAVRLCDGALVVVDVIEGVAIQTHAVLRQAWEERLQPCLVLNKVDRLVTELQLEPVEAYEHLFKIIERVNAILQGFLSASVMLEASKRQDAANAVEAMQDSDANQEWLLDYDDDEEDALIFSPEKGNVVFCSAVDGWAFRVADFVPMVSEALGIANKRKVLQSLWGSYFFNPKTKKIVANKQIQVSVTTGQASRQHPPMFATMILESLWQVYGATVVESKPKRLNKIVEKLGLQDAVNKRDVAKGGRMALRTVMHAWLPVPRAILSMVVRRIPDPARAQRRRLDVLWPVESRPLLSESEEAELERVKQGVRICDPNAPLVAYVTKIFAVERAMLRPPTLAKLEALYSQQAPGPQGAVDSTEQEKTTAQEQQQEFFFAFARVYSGTAREGQPVHVLGPKYQMGHPDRQQHKSLVSTGILPMLIMNTDLVALEAVPAGNIVAFAGLDQHVLKTATITSSPVACSLTKMPSQSAPILRVSLEPVNPLEWPQLAQGLKLLNRADPVAEVRIQANGEHVLGAIGELHLERCVKDLTSRFAKIELKVSKPIAVFRETIVLASKEGGPAVPLNPRQQFTPVDVDAEEASFQRQRQEYEAALAGAAVATPPPDDNQDSDQDGAEDRRGISKEKPIALSKRVYPGGRVLARTPQNTVVVTLRMIPLPEDLTRFIEKSKAALAAVLVDDDDVMDELEFVEGETDAAADDAGDAVVPPKPPAIGAGVTARSLSNVSNVSALSDHQRSELEKLQRETKAEFVTAFAECPDANWDEGLLDCVWSFGPRGCGPNLLINMLPDGPLSKHQFAPFDQGRENESQEEGSSRVHEEIAAGIVAGFQLACRAGPLCEEPLYGTAVVVEHVSIKDQDREEVVALRQQQQFAIQGQVMSCFRESVRRAFDLHRKQHEHKVPTGCEVRLVEGVFRCMLQCHVESHMGDQLGKLYGVLSGRRAKVVSEDMWEGTSIFTVEALIPIVESFNLGDDLRRQTSGAASTPQLVFSHWQVIPENPFFRATTEDELEEFGERR